jgi:hypothetical protein
LQQLYNTATAADVFILDPSMFQIASMNGNTQKMLGNTGHSENRLLSNQWMTKCFREDAHGLVADIDPTAAVVA